MGDDPLGILNKRLDDENLQKLIAINNPKLFAFIAKYIQLCNPSRVFVCTDSEEDLQYIRHSTFRNHEEATLAIPGHTIHFDGYRDQARDKANTKFLVPKGKNLGPEINSIDYDEGVSEIHELMKGIMFGHEVFVKFFCLGPLNSPFSIPCVQLTDSSYVAHSEDLLYRQGYQEFVRLGRSAKFFKFVHSQGELLEAGLGLMVCKNVERRRVYIDLENETIYSVNTQYGGNTIGLKKLAMRLAINRGSTEGWLTEHMLLMGINGPKESIKYFTGAFPSMCGKTSTAMINDETIVGDDIVYLKKLAGKIRGVNVEKGMFGIIEGINSEDDPLQWSALHTPAEIIFSNVLVTENKEPYWNGKDNSCPEDGWNHSGPWKKGKKDENGLEITPSHKNARFTLDLGILDNVDPQLHDPNGLEVSGFIYGGRDSDTWVPVEEAFDWKHGIITKGACLESETTAATLGKEGVRVFNPMSNLDFLSIPIGKYIQDNLDFCRGVECPPKIFSVNYFLKNDQGKFMNHKNDKHVWLKWMGLRVNNNVGCITTPTGYIPKYKDLKLLFDEVLNKKYTERDYIEQFTVRIPQNLAKIERLVKIYRERVLDTPEILFEVLEEQRQRLISAKDRFGDHIEPGQFEQ